MNGVGGDYEQYGICVLVFYSALSESCCQHVLYGPAGVECTIAAGEVGGVLAEAGGTVDQDGFYQCTGGELPVVGVAVRLLEKCGCTGGEGCCSGAAVLSVGDEFWFDAAIEGGSFGTKEWDGIKGVEAACDEYVLGLFEAACEVGPAGQVYVGAFCGGIGAGIAGGKNVEECGVADHTGIVGGGVAAVVVFYANAVGVVLNADVVLAVGGGVGQENVEAGGGEGATVGDATTGEVGVAGSSDEGGHDGGVCGLVGADEGGGEDAV